MLNWEAISKLKGTLVFLMGMKNLPTIVQELTARGYGKDKPAAIVEWGTHPQQRSVDGTLGNIVELAEAEDFKAPSVIVVGDVVAYRQQLNFHENLPLSAGNPHPAVRDGQASSLAQGCWSCADYFPCSRFG